MRKFRYVLLLFLLVKSMANLVLANDAEPDIEKLKHLTDTAPQQSVALAEEYLTQFISEEIRLQILAEQCTAYMVLSDYAGVGKIYHASIDTTLKPGNEKYRVTIESCYARALERQGHINQAMEIYNRMIDLARENDLKYSLAIVYSSRGQLSSYQGNYASSIKDLAQAFEQFELSGEEDEHLKLQLMNAMGNTYGYMKQYEKSLQYYFLVLEQLGRLGDVFGQSIATYNIANTYIYTEEFETALEYAKRSKAFSVEADDTLGIAYADMQIASCLAKLGQLQAALDAVSPAQAIFIQFEEMEGVAKSHLKRAQWLHDLSRSTEALPHALEAAKIYTEMDALAGQETSHELLSQLYYTLGNFQSAYDSLLKRFKLSEQIFDTDMNRQVAQMEAKFNARIQVQENELLKAQNLVKQAELDKIAARRNKVLLLILALFSIAAILTWQLVLNRRASKQLALAARTDALTGISNRRHIMELLNQERDRALRYKDVFTLLLMDVDHFKQINDTYGHSAGDNVLVAIADTVQLTLRAVDQTARYGGEEFLVMLPRTSAEQAQQLVERLLHAISQIKLEGIQQSITASLGYAEFDGDESLDALLNRADKAMYQAKNGGRNQAVAALSQ